MNDPYNIDDIQPAGRSSRVCPPFLVFRFQRNKCINTNFFSAHSWIFSIVGRVIRDLEVGYSPSDRQGSNFKARVWRTMSSDSCHLILISGDSPDPVYPVRAQDLLILFPRHYNTDMPYHHALSPPPSHHHLYIIHLINWLQRFYRIIMSLERPFVPKSDVKQWFTTT